VRHRHRETRAQTQGRTTAGVGRHQGMWGPFRSPCVADQGDVRLVRLVRLVLRQAAAAGDAHPVRMPTCVVMGILGRSPEGAGTHVAVVEVGTRVAVVGVRWTDGQRHVVTSGESRCRRLEGPAAVAGAVVDSPRS